MRVTMMKLFNLLLSPIGRVASRPMKNIETFPSKQMYLYLSLVERKVAEFYHNTWLKWLVFIAFSGQLMVSLKLIWRHWIPTWCHSHFCPVKAITFWDGLFIQFVLDTGDTDLGTRRSLWHDAFDNDDAILGMRLCHDPCAGQRPSTATNMPASVLLITSYLRDWRKGPGSPSTTGWSKVALPHPPTHPPLDLWRNHRIL